MNDVKGFLTYAKSHFTYDNKYNHTLVISSGQFVNDTLKVIKDFGENAMNVKVLIFTMSLDMNKPIMNNNRETVISVNFKIPEMMFAMNEYLNYTKIPYKPGVTFADHEDAKGNLSLSAAMEFNTFSDS
jgi:hypothetical protein